MYGMPQAPANGCLSGGGRCILRGGICRGGPAAQTGVRAEGAAATDPAAEDATAAAGQATVGRGLGHTVHAGLDYFAQ